MPWTDDWSPQEFGIVTNDCPDASGAEAFFAYVSGSTACGTSTCSITGMNEVNKDVMFFVQDESGAVDLVILHDDMSPANNDGGKVQMSVYSDGLAGVGTHVKAFDDRGGRNASDGIQWYVALSISPRPGGSLFRDQNVMQITLFSISSGLEHARIFSATVTLGMKALEKDTSLGNGYILKAAVHVHLFCALHPGCCLRFLGSGFG